ncbi:uncharacterized protein KY384_002095 [Bacidia gigantensis]|uniref:uncharacterized protein n=1 Tax=Bacidia gigantensis TaxID=2732470 RepID=UPI001D03E081|nr:uncharacterized protein KY384_002095 [Bacidia gigantensis]KAG8533312.1 hypothetical protein KY384_002095 [Bacidia gigantensis]
MDGDSQMGELNSPSTDSEEAMFPAANTSVESSASFIPPNINDILFSPPPSQNQTNQGNEVDGAVQMEDLGTTKKSDFGKEPQDTFVLGASWNNKKARDEWQRAWNLLEDRQFNLRRGMSEPMKPT